MKGAKNLLKLYRPRTGIISRRGSPVCHHHHHHHQPPRTAIGKEFSSSASAASSSSSTPSTVSKEEKKKVTVNQYKASEDTTNQKNNDDNDTVLATSTTRILNNPENSETTAMVDELLAYTRQLMDSAHANSAPNTTNLNGNHHHVRHVVAFSGGIDSSLVLALLETCRSSNDYRSDGDGFAGVEESVQAVIGRSFALSNDQLMLARQVANHIGTPLIEVNTTEGDDETYIANTGQACFACKTHLYSALEAVADHAAAASEQQQQQSSRNNRRSNTLIQQQQQQPIIHHQLYNGTNADDVVDTTRVGLIAARNFRVQSPLIQTTKDNVRKIAKHMGLPNWNVAASPCLRSRLALGVQATQNHLQRIEQAESFVRKQLNGLLKETTNLRVRLLSGNRAMLEIDHDILPHVESFLNGSDDYYYDDERRKGAISSSSESSSSWQNHFVHTLDFASISARAFKSGSVSKPTTTTSSSSATTVSKKKKKEDDNKDDKQRQSRNRTSTRILEESVAV